MSETLNYKKINEMNIVKLKEIRPDHNNLYEIDRELFNEKVKEYKKKIDNGDYEFEDTILNMTLIFQELSEDKEEKYRNAGKIMLDAMFKNIDKEGK